MFAEVKKNFGFGCMRLPLIDGEVDKEEMNKMVDAFLEKGFNYFDTAHGYLDGKSETALRDCLTSRYPRDKYLLTNKLSPSFFEKEEDIIPLFEEQLKCCGVEYFDFYLMHAQNARLFEKYKACNAYETALKLKEMGKIRHVGISFHDTAEVLDNILTTYPFIEVVQIQFNYLDYDDPYIQSKKCYDVCVKHQKPVIVMEPVKGGNLVNLTDEAKKIYENLGSLSPASYAIRFAAGFEKMMMVLSGMSNLEQMNDNLSYMADFKPLNDKEHEAIGKVKKILESIKQIPCTGCHYCVLDNHCPKDIMIPEIFACYNKKKAFNDWTQNGYYLKMLTVDHGKASECLKCGMCEAICPQKLNIRQLLEECAGEFEKH